MASCKKEFSDPNWDIDILAPLMKTSLTIDKIIDDSLTSVNTDSLVSLIYQDEIYRFNLDTMFNIPDTSIEYTAKLSNLDLGTVEVTMRKSLGDIAMYDLAENGNVAGGLYDIIMTGHNTGNPASISAISQQVYNDLTADLTQYFQTITVLDGYIDIEFDNGMPVDFTNVFLELRNQSNSAVVLQDTFLLIPAWGNVSHTKSLAGKTVEGNMEGSVMFESPGSNGSVTIDTSMAMVITVRVYNVSIESATAVFPSQNIVDEGGTASFNNNDVQLTEAIVKQGNIFVDIYNTIEEQLHYGFEIPGALKNGTPLYVSGSVPAATSTSPGHTTLVKDIAGYSLDLKGIGPVEQLQGDLNGNGYIDQDTVNSLYYIVTGAIDSTGNLITMSLDDSIYVNIGFSEILPEYAKGYLGQQTINLTGSEDLDVFGSILAGNFDLEDVSLSIAISNQIGVTGGVVINSFDVVNTNTMATAQLNVPSQYTPFIITKPTDPQSLTIPVIPAISIMSLNQTNSNPDKLIEIMPDKLDYDLQFTVNMNTSPPPLATGTDFVYANSEVVATLDVEVPLSFMANSITLIDTAEFLLSEKDIENINEGTIILYADNGFPLNAIVELFMLDEVDAIIGKLLPNTTIEAGKYDYVSERITEPVRTKIKIPVSNARLNELTQTKKIKIITKFTTNPYNTYVKIYNNYEINFKIIGDFSYHVN